MKSWMKRAFVVQTILLVAAATLVVLMYQQRAQAGRTFEQLELFSEVLSKVQTVYVDEPDVDKIMVGAINGMIAELDPHSEYMPPTAFKEMKVQTTGEFGGLGIEITMKEGVLTVVSPIEDTPAYRAGMQANDQITHVDGQAIKGLSLEEAVEKLRGKVGSEVKITVVREGTRPFDLMIVRDKIRVKSVKWSLEDGDIGYIKLLQFKQRSTEELIEALNQVLASKPVGLILDLRNNPGGLLDQAVGVADVFLKEGKVVYTNGRTRDSKMEFFAADDGSEPSLPLVVLINGGSASASEIVAGALHDHKRALLVGARTFGKGSVQTILPLSNNGGLRVTTALYYTPSGISIQAAGIKPDIEVEAFPGANELMLREENIDGHFENRSGIGQAPLTKEEIQKKIEEQRDRIQQFREGKLEDTQLKRAKELIRSIEIFGPSLNALSGLAASSPTTAAPAQATGSAPR